MAWAPSCQAYRAATGRLQAVAQHLTELGDVQFTHGREGLARVGPPEDLLTDPGTPALGWLRVPGAVVPPEEELNLRCVAVTRAESECHSATWMRFCSHLGIFHRVLDQLALQPQQRALAEWNSENHSYFQRNIWLQYHWQWLRIQEENPNLTTLTISLSEAVAAGEAKAAKSNAVKVAASRLQPSRDEEIEDWPWLDQEVLRKSRSRQVCMTRHFFRHHPGPNCIPLLTCHLHQGLIAHGDHRTHRCSGWTEEPASPEGLGA